MNVGDSGFTYNVPLIRSKTFADASRVKARLGGVYAEGLTWFDLQSWNSSQATGGFDPERWNGWAVHKATGNLALVPSGAAGAGSGAQPQLLVNSYQTDKTYGGSTTDAAGVVEIQKLAIGTGAAARIQTAGTAAPTTGAHGRGEIVWNLTPSAAGPMGWMCVTAGSPGTWKAMPNLEA